MKKVNLNKAYKNWYYTIVGAGGDVQEWIDGYEKMLAEKQIGKPINWFYCKGTDINEKYNLADEDKINNDLVFLFFPLDGLPVDRLAVFKIAMQDHWFTDYVDNITV